MKYGVVYPQTELGGDPDAVRQIGLATEELGFDYLLAYDHVVGAVHADREPKLWGPYTEHDPFHDPFVMFAYLAGMTERIEFASGVLILPQRQTVLVAKQAADLDLLSGERFRMGVGVGWNYVEYDALGQDFSTRGRRADEQIEYLRTLWSEDLVDWTGEFDAMDRGTLIPKPKRQIPIWIGGFSPAAFRRGAELGDGFMYAGDEGRVFRAKDDVVARAAENGRDMTDYGHEWVGLRAGDPQNAADAAERWREAGGTHFASVSMGQGLDSIEAHLDYFSNIAERLISE
ncbi:LLM class F420-dependent oxidoreductase [Ilumatobacter coccineus]|uniref:Putative oxidoreductase n=1 Tax=Ilumatobacter coccineus (strain NBRC 103263 / KCTC 29153 / YM16-304) TaxID=1313172 RepID=A0A6C7E9T3_ILUCY|nr:LLM class F420-dependent oxidoreductase [Ilumatobacter coccineus]BAN01979.1 putative oxidoreductase [Ilumatobacter coccineus YM16-304]